MVEPKEMWFAYPPKTWGSMPDKMSPSALAEIESCPRKYSLQRASYPAIWERSGYPVKLTTTSLEGQIIHGALEQIIKALKHSNCPSISDELFVTTMRSLKGYPGVLETQLDKIVSGLKNNPRLKHKAEHINKELRRGFPSLHEQVQIQISQLKFDFKPKTGTSTYNSSFVAFLSEGIHSEVELNVPELGWKGTVDYLHLSKHSCEIIDFKSGRRKPDHIFQIKIYNLLWLLDKKQNPNGIPVKSLILSYKDGRALVAPLEHHEVKDFIEDLRRRTKSAELDISEFPPGVRPSLENCNFCPVRQLCNPYWTSEIQNALAEEKFSRLPIEVSQSIDIEVALEDRIANHLWKAQGVNWG